MFIKPLLLLMIATAANVNAYAAENLKLNQHLDYSSDSHDGPLITGDQMADGTLSGNLLRRGVFQFKTAGATHGGTLRKI
jgi:hypothetical protein